MSGTIVVPLGGPDLEGGLGDDWVLPVVRALANRTNARVLLVSVVDVQSEKRSVVSLLQEPVLSESEVMALVTSWREYLAQVATALPRTDVDTEVRVGRPMDEILRILAREEQPLLVMATHGRLGISRVLFGSVALDVLPGTRDPVVLVREPVPDPWPLDSIVVALDGSVFAEVALESTLAALGVEDLTLYLVHSIDYLSGEDFPTTKRRVARYLGEVADRLVEQGAVVDWEIRTGAAAQDLIRVAEERSAGLIAMASHGRSGLGRLLLGSVAERVVHQSPVPVLLIRPDTALVDQLEAERRSQPERRLRVRDIMTHPVVTVLEDATLQDVALAMLENRIGSIPVVDQDGRLIGMLTETDFGIGQVGIPFTDVAEGSRSGDQVPLEGIEHIFEMVRTVRARELMSFSFVTVSEQETVSAVIGRMREHGITHIPVVREGIPVGIISRHDLLKLLVPREEDDPDLD